MIRPVEGKTESMLPEGLTTPKNLQSTANTFQHVASPYAHVLRDTKPITIMSRNAADNLVKESCKTPVGGFTPSTVVTDLDPSTPTFSRITARINKPTIIRKGSLLSIDSIENEISVRSSDDCLPCEGHVDLTHQENLPFVYECQLSVESPIFSIEELKHYQQYKPITHKARLVLETSLEHMMEEAADLASEPEEQLLLSSIPALKCADGIYESIISCSVTTGSDSCQSEHSFTVSGEKMPRCRYRPFVLVPRKKLLPRSLSDVGIRSTNAVYLHSVDI